MHLNRKRDKNCVLPEISAKKKHLGAKFSVGWTMSWGDTNETASRLSRNRNSIFQAELDPMTIFSKSQFCVIAQVDDSGDWSWTETKPEIRFNILDNLGGLWSEIRVRPQRCR